MSNLRNRTTIKPMRFNNMERALLRIEAELNQVITCAPLAANPMKAQRLRQEVADLLDDIEELWDPDFTPRAEGMKGPVDG